MLDRLVDAFDGTMISVWGPFGMLMLCGIGLPIPEDLILIAAGFLGASNGHPLPFLCVLMYIAIILGDGIMFCLGWFAGRRVLKSRFGQWVMTESRLNKAEYMFHKYGSWVVFVGRFLPGLRTPIFFSAGLLRFSIGRFLFMDGLAAIVSAPLFVFLGHFAFEHYAEDLSSLEKTIGRTKLVVGLVVLVISVAVFYWIRSRRRIKNAS